MLPEIYLETNETSTTATLKKTQGAAASEVVQVFHYDISTAFLYRLFIQLNMRRHYYPIFNFVLFLPISDAYPYGLYLFVFNLINYYYYLII